MINKQDIAPTVLSILKNIGIDNYNIDSSCFEILDDNSFLVHSIIIENKNETKGLCLFHFGYDFEMQKLELGLYFIYNNDCPKKFLDEILSKEPFGMKSEESCDGEINLAKYITNISFSEIEEHILSFVNDLKKNSWLLILINNIGKMENVGIHFDTFNV